MKKSAKNCKNSILFPSCIVACSNTQTNIKTSFLFHFTRPADVVADIYPNLEVPRSQVTEKSSDLFDAAVGEVIDIIVSFDMGWSKRANGRSYDSLNGYAAIIRYWSRKILDYCTRNRKCNSCDLGHDKADHDCRKNFIGSAKAVEADAGVELINNSSILKELRLTVRVIVEDGDCSTIASVKKSRENSVHKLCEKNHLTKNVSKELYILVASFTYVFYIL